VQHNAEQEQTEENQCKRKGRKEKTLDEIGTKDSKEDIHDGKIKYSVGMGASSHASKDITIGAGHLRRNDKNQ